MIKKQFKMTMLLFFCIFMQSMAADWQNLINGTKTKQFRLLNGTAEFKVVDGSIVGISKINSPNSFLATKQEYSDFILEFDVMDSRLNSGVQIRSLSIPEYMNGRVHGYQVEIDPSPRAWSGGIYDEARRGWLYNLEGNPSAKTAFKAKQWNHFRVEAIGNRIRVFLNGQPSADLIDDMTAKGFIAFQVHDIGADSSLAGEIVQWRNLRILTADLQQSVLPETDIPQISYLNNQLSEREKAEGWQLLWDGQSSSGWRGASLAAFPEKGWKIGNGILTVQKNKDGEGPTGGDIVTDKIFTNFELQADFCLSKGANSGIKYFIDTEVDQGKRASIGCEYQILDDEFHPDAKLGTAGNRTLASLYDLIPPDARFYAPNESVSKRVNAYGWNRARIIVNGRHVEHYLNGIKQLEYERGNQMWRALVSRSKFVIWPDFGEAKQGHILLQDHGDEVQFRNIKIKEIK